MRIVVSIYALNKTGKLLMVRENKESCRGIWNLPAGGLEENESIFAVLPLDVISNFGGGRKRP